MGGVNVKVWGSKYLILSLVKVKQKLWKQKIDTCRIRQHVISWSVGEDYTWITRHTCCMDLLCVWLVCCCVFALAWIPCCVGVVAGRGLCAAKESQMTCKHLSVWLQGHNLCTHTHFSKTPAAVKPATRINDRKLTENNFSHDALHEQVCFYNGV